MPATPPGKQQVFTWKNNGRAKRSVEMQSATTPPRPIRAPRAGLSSSAVPSLLAQAAGRASQESLEGGAGGPHARQSARFREAARNDGRLEFGLAPRNAPRNDGAGDYGAFSYPEVEVQVTSER